MTNGMRVKQWGAVVLGVVVLLVSIRVLTASAERSNEAAATVISHLQNRHHGSGGLRQFNSLDDLLSNVVYSMPGRETRPLTDAVVVGKVAAVSKGMGFYVEGKDGPTGIETDFDDDRVLWRTVHVTLDVEQVVSGDVAGEQITVGFAFGDAISFEQIRSDFLSYESLLLFLQKQQPVFDYDSTVYGTIMDGALLGLVATDGSFELPVLEEAEESEFTRKAATVDELARAARGEPREIRLDASGAMVGGRP